MTKPRQTTARGTPRPKATPPPASLVKSRTKDRALAVKVRELIHELHVHAEKIAAQNEQLLKAHAEAAEARNRFADLYDLAPIGYLSLDQTGVITEVNLCGAALLGRTRALLLNTPLTDLVQRPDRAKLRVFLREVVHSLGAGTAPHIEVTLRTDDGHIVRLIARARRQKDSTAILVAMIDMTHERQLERERETAIALEVARTAELAGEVSDRVTAEERVKALLDRLVGIQEEERRRLSRNLHDHLGQQLTALRLAIGAVKERGRAAGESNSRIGVIEAIVTDLDRDIDRLAWDLRPPVLDDNGLGAALDTLVRDWAAMTGVAAEFHISSAPEPRLARDIESHVYRIVQEALTNVAKHAKANRVSVLLKQAREELAVIVEDDGQGFREPAVASADTGMGLISMRERAALLGGEIQIESIGRGATVFVKIPLKTLKLM